MDLYRSSFFFFLFHFYFYLFVCVLPVALTEMVHVYGTTSDAGWLVSDYMHSLFDTFIDFDCNTK